MDINSTKLIYFSPTRTTENVLKGIAEGIGAEPITHLDLTSPGVKPPTSENPFDEVALIGVPVYGGRVPPVAASRLKRLKAQGTPTVVVV